MQTRQRLFLLTSVALAMLSACNSILGLDRDLPGLSPIASTTSSGNATSGNATSGSATSGSPSSGSTSGSGAAGSSSSGDATASSSSSSSSSTSSSSGGTPTCKGLNPVPVGTNRLWYFSGDNQNLPAAIKSLPAESSSCGAFLRAESAVEVDPIALPMGTPGAGAITFRIRPAVGSRFSLLEWPNDGSVFFLSLSESVIALFGSPVDAVNRGAPLTKDAWQNVAIRFLDPGPAGPCTLRMSVDTLSPIDFLVTAPCPSGNSLFYWGRFVGKTDIDEYAGWESLTVEQIPEVFQAMTPQ
jgi:hypothetical protein